MKRKLLGTIAIAVAAGAISAGTAGAATSGIVFEKSSENCRIGILAFPHFTADINPSAVNRSWREFREICGNPTDVRAGRVTVGL